MHSGSDIFFFTEGIFSEEALSITICKIFNILRIFSRKLLVVIGPTNLTYQSIIKEVNIFQYLRGFTSAIIVYSFTAIVNYLSIFYFISAISTSIVLIISFQRSKRTTYTDISKLIAFIATVMSAISILVFSTITHFAIVQLRWVARAMCRDVS